MINWPPFPVFNKEGIQYLQMQGCVKENYIDRKIKKRTKIIDETKTINKFKINHFYNP